MIPLVSVALCTHNGSTYVAEQLRSIAAQTVRPAEIVVSDDASTDDTVDIVREFAESIDGEMNIVIIENEKALGVVRNFEQAMRGTASEFIALSDQDDVWHPRRLEAILARFGENSDLVLVSSDARLVDGDGEPLPHSLFDALEISDREIASINAGDGLGQLLRRNLVTGATTVIRRDLFELAVPFPEPWVHDEWLAVIAAAIGGFGVLNEQLTDYRQHGNNQIGATKLGFSAKVGRLMEPRLSRNLYLLERAEALRGRIVQLGAAVSPTVLRAVDQKVAHQRARAAIPASRLRRLPAIVREVRTGRYALYSRGWLDVARDLLQPAR